MHKVYRGHMFRGYVSDCGAFSWGYGPEPCTECMGKENPLGTKTCQCDRVPVTKTTYDHMWHRFHKSKGTPCGINVLPAVPVAPECDNDSCTTFMCRGGCSVIRVTRGKHS